MVIPRIGDPWRRHIESEATCVEKPLSLHIKDYSTSLSASYNLLNQTTSETEDHDLKSSARSEWFDIFMVSTTIHCPNCSRIPFRLSCFGHHLQNGMHAAPLTLLNTASTVLPHRFAPRQRRLMGARYVPPSVGQPGECLNDSSRSDGLSLWCQEYPMMWSKGRTELKIGDVNNWLDQTLTQVDKLCFNLYFDKAITLPTWRLLEY